MDEFKKIIGDLIRLFRQLIKIEEVKLNAAAGKHVATLEDCVTQEQALLLRLRGLEQNREKAQAKAGYGGLSFREILEKVPDSEREELYGLFDELSREVQMFREISEDSSQILQTNLHMIQKALNKKTGGVYNEKGKSETELRHMTSRKA